MVAVTLSAMIRGIETDQGLLRASRRNVRPGMVDPDSLEAINGRPVDGGNSRGDLDGTFVFCIQDTL